MSDGRIQGNRTIAELRMKRSPHLIVYFSHRDLIFENYITRQAFRGSPDTIKLLDSFDEWKTPMQTSLELSGYTRKSVLDSARNLLERGLLITKQSDQAKIADQFGEDWEWPTASKYYHFSSKIDEPFASPSEIRGYYLKHLKGRKQPSIYKSYPSSPKIRLPTPSGPNVPLFVTLGRRITTREFSGLPITLKQLSIILYNTWGEISTYRTQEFGRLLHKTSPSAGGRHPIEAYAIVNGVKGISPGVYHYSARDHSLELLRAGDFKSKCESLTAGQVWTRDASVLFFMTAVVARTAWKYRVPRVYRAFLLDAGHLSQSFLLSSTGLGLGAFCIGVFSDVTVERELGLDGVNEIALFGVGVGHVATTRRRQGTKRLTQIENV